MKSDILILSIENDPSTSEVIEWLKYGNKECDRINNIVYYDQELNIDILGDSLFKYHWNGEVNGTGQISPEEVYIYKIMVTDAENKAHSYVGNVTLLK